MGLCASSTVKLDDPASPAKANPVVPSPDNSPSKNKARKSNVAKKRMSRPGANTVQKSRRVPKGDEKWRKGRQSFREQMKKDRMKFMKKKREGGGGDVVVVVSCKSPKNAIKSKQGDLAMTDYD